MGEVIYKLSAITKTMEWTNQVDSAGGFGFLLFVMKKDSKNGILSEEISNSTFLYP